MSGNELRVGVGMAVARCLDDAPNAFTFFQMAEMALDKSEKRGEGCWSFTEG